MLQPINHKINPEYFDFAISHLSIDMDRTGTYALMPSENQKNDPEPYIVRIDESGNVPAATNCNCADHQYRSRKCKHMIIVNCYFERIYSKMARKIAVTIEPTPEEIAAIAEELNMKKLAAYRLSVQTGYETLGATKQLTTLAYGCCGHLVHPQHEGELCGACLCK